MKDVSSRRANPRTLEALAKNGHSFWIGTTLAAILILTALLKLLHFLQMPISNARPDVVVNFISNRELLLLSALFEVSVAAYLLKSIDAWRSALAILYFSLCATIYHLGLLVQGDLPCPCLGVVSDWMGHGVTTFVSRIILLVFWGLGVLLAWRSRNGLGCKAISRAARVFALVLCSSLVELGSANASILLEGDYFYKSTSPRTGMISTDDRKFSAMLDEGALAVMSIPPGEGLVLLGGSCTNTVFISREAVISMLWCRGSETTYVTFSPPEYAWDLGNCGDGLTSWVFMALRSRELFSVSYGSGVRPLASPMALIGSPIGLITEAEYSETGVGDSRTLVCKIRVSEHRLRNWLNSPLLSPGFNPKNELARERSRLRHYKAGFLYEEITFSRFTNIAGIEFPRLLESKIFTPLKPSVPRKGMAVGQTSAGESQPTSSSTGPQTPGLYGTVTVNLRIVDPLWPETPAVLPASNSTFSISEARLGDREHHIGGVNYYQSNSLISSEVSPVARSAFESAVEKARHAENVRRWNRVLTAALAAILLSGPLLIFLRSRRPRTIEVSLGDEGRSS